MARIAVMLVASLVAIAALGTDPVEASIDLRSTSSLATLDGQPGSLVPVGDLDGDGFAELATFDHEPAEGRRCPGEPKNEIEPYEDPPTQQTVVRVIPGGPGLRPFGPEAPAGAWRLACPDRPLRHLSDAAGTALAGVGDVDGDGIDDLAIGEGSTAPAGRSGAGSVYLVLGRKGAVGGDLQALGDGGIRIDGPAREARLGQMIAPVGDVDGDGHADLAVGYLRNDVPDGERWRVAIVHGLRPGQHIDLASPGPNVLIVEGLWPNPVLAAAGDVDGDGLGDIAIGEAQPRREADLLRYPGRVRVIAGGIGSGTVRVGALRTLMRITGDDSDSLGAVVAPAGDVDGDGRGDLLIGATPDPLGVIAFFLRPNRQSVYVVRGRPGASIDLTRRSEPGVRRIRGPLTYDGGFGAALVGLPDMTGDGVPELAIGAPSTTPLCRSDAGAVFVVPGDRAFTSTRLERVPGAGRMIGRLPSDRVGAALALARPFGPPALLVSGQGGEDSARSTVWVVDPRPAMGGLAVDDSARCLRVRTIGMSLTSLRREGGVRLRIDSDLGEGQAHSIRVSVAAAAAPTGTLTRRELATAFEDLRPAQARRVVRLDGPGTRTLWLRLPARVVRALRAHSGGVLSVDVEQQRPLGAGYGRFRALGATRFANR